MTDEMEPSAPERKPGDVANGHILTAAGWLPLRRLPLGSPGPYYAGDLLDSNAYTGTDWVYVPVVEAAEVPQADGVRPAFAPLPGPAPKRSSGRGWLIALSAGVAPACRSRDHRRDCEIR